ncbi:hypothetical protein BJ742DRAFT_799329 [Cladochytrium replicatum]|nr:hypothetical protein BJ742DRAFT_799329 [Cladochytrium replicatum]
MEDTGHECCSGCGNPIELQSEDKHLEEPTETIQRQLIRFSGGGVYHPACFMCGGCGNVIKVEGDDEERGDTLLASEDGKPLCLKCCTRCRRCGEAILGDVISTGNNESYHAECFCCCKCGEQIQDMRYATVDEEVCCVTCSVGKSDLMENEQQRKEHGKNTQFDAPRRTSSSAATADEVRPTPKSPSHLPPLLQNALESVVRDPRVATEYIVGLEADLRETREQLEASRRELGQAERDNLKTRAELAAAKADLTKESERREAAEHRIASLESDSERLQEHLHAEVRELWSIRAQLLAEIPIESPTTKPLSSRNGSPIRGRGPNSRPVSMAVIDSAADDRRTSSYTSPSQSRSSTASMMKKSTEALAEGGEEHQRDKRMSGQGWKSTLHKVTNAPTEMLKKAMQPLGGKGAGAVSPGTGTSGASLKSKKAMSRSENDLARVSETSPTKGEQGGKHRHDFQQHHYLRPRDSDCCSEKLWGKEMRCAGCGFHAHTKCAPSIPANCSRNMTKSTGNLSATTPTSPVFGADLSRTCAVENEQVPFIVRKCIAVVEERGMDYEGIYRKSGPMSQINRIVQAANKGEDLSFLDTAYTDADPEAVIIDITAVTSALKQYFRDLPEPLFTVDLYPAFIGAVRLGDEVDRANALASLVGRLPDEHRRTLEYLIRHLARVASLSNVNLMTTSNLGVVFGPTLLHGSGNNDDILESGMKCGVVEYLIRNVDAVFSWQPSVQQSVRVNDGGGGGGASLPISESGVLESVGSLGAGSLIAGSLTAGSMLTREFELEKGDREASVDDWERAGSSGADSTHMSGKERETSEEGAGKRRSRAVVDEEIPLGW